MSKYLCGSDQLASLLIVDFDGNRFHVYLTAALHALLWLARVSRVFRLTTRFSRYLSSVVGDCQGSFF